MRGVKFQPQLLPTLLSGCFLFFLLFLGRWQLHRYHYKEDLQQHFTAALHHAPLPFSQALKQVDKQFLHAQVSGQFMKDKVFLLQNRWHNEQTGVEIINVFKPKNSNRYLLVNRGWIPTGKINNKKLLAGHSNALTGYLKLHNEYVFILGENILDTKKWPMLMQKVDMNQVEKITGLKFYPFVLRLDSNAATKPPIRDWKPINVMPQRHLGYAVQWFVMALVLALAYLIFSCQRDKTFIKSE